MLLVADQDGDLREFVRTTLEGPRLHVFEAWDGPSTLRLAKQVVPHVMLLGSSIFGGLTGDVVRRLGEDPDTSEIRIILVDDGERDDDAPAAGIDARLARPFSPPELVRTVEWVMSREEAAN